MHRPTEECTERIEEALIAAHRDVKAPDRAIVTVEHAGQKLTSDIADFRRTDGGRLVRGACADIVVIDPERLDDTGEAIHEAPMTGLPDS